MPATTVRDRTVLTASRTPLILFGVLDRDTNEIVESFENRLDAREAAAILEARLGGEFISIRIPVQYD